VHNSKRKVKPARGDLSIPERSASIWTTEEGKYQGFSAVLMRVPRITRKARKRAMATISNMCSVGVRQGAFFET
jgi:hypothetical protein